MSFYQLPYQNILAISLPHANGIIIPYYGPGIRKLGAYMDLFTPKWVKPNHISFAAFLGVFLPLCFAFVQHLSAPLEPLPASWQLILALGYLIYETLDELDGIHARSTGQSSRLGAFLDDAIDCWGFSIGLFAQLYLAIWLPLAAWQIVALMMVCLLGSFDNCHNYFYPRSASLGDDIALMRHMVCLTHVLVYFLGIPLWLYWFWTALLFVFFGLFVVSIAKVVLSFGVRWGTACYLINHIAVTIYATMYFLNPDTSLTDRWYVVIAVCHAMYLLQFVLLAAAFVGAQQVFGAFEAMWPSVICLLCFYRPQMAMTVSLSVTVAIVSYCLYRMNEGEKLALSNTVDNGDSK